MHVAWLNPFESNKLWQHMAQTIKRCLHFNTKLLIFTVLQQEVK